MEVEDLNCTQFGEPFPKPGTDEAGNSTIPWLITTVVTFYRPFHYYLYVTIVVFSVFANFIILIVLAQKEMRGTGVNVTMMFIAVCDFLCSIAAVVQQFLRAIENYDSYFVAYSRITVDYLSVAFHALSLYLAVGMAFCRVMTLSLSRRQERWQTPKYAISAASVMFAPVFAISSVVLFLNTVKESEEDGIYLEISDLSLKNHCLFMKVALITSGSCFKALPCVLMLLLSLFLLGRIEKAKKVSVSVASNQKEKSDKIDRSSRFIQFILVVFVVTESPQALFSIIGGLFVIDYLNYYQMLASIMNTLSIFNTTTSFIIYSTLSAKFRKLFVSIFFPKTIVERIYRKRSTVIVQPTTQTSSHPN